MERLIAANLHFLEQAGDLLERLDDEQYARPVASFYNSSAGGHVRHCLEHYHSLLAGVGSGKVDYDDRKRDRELECDTACARAQVDEVRERLKALATGEAPVGLLVKMDCGGEEIEWQPSTMGRELQFLVSHTVHHCAMIGGICKELGVELEEGFGVAPSTLRHQQALGGS